MANRSGLVLGVGISLVDRCAFVDEFPKPDSKSRTTAYVTRGGGNCFSALSTLSKLKQKTTILTKVGDDDVGKAIIERIKASGVASDHVVVKKGATSPHSYVIIDSKTHSRTIIHTPGSSELELNELPVLETLTGQIGLVYLDSRHTIAAARVARWAGFRGIPIVLDVEKQREPKKDFVDILKHATYIVSNRGYVSTWTGERTEPMAGLAALLQFCEEAKYIIMTLGPQGSLLISATELSDPSVADVESLEQLLTLATQQHDEPTSQVYRYRMEDTVFKLVYCPAYELTEEETVDTNSAGDAYIGALCFSIQKGMAPEKGMKLASFVAAVKCKRAGEMADCIPPLSEVEKYIETHCK